MPSLNTHTHTPQLQTEPDAAIAVGLPAQATTYPPLNQRESERESEREREGERGRERGRERKRDRCTVKGREKERKRKKTGGNPSKGGDIWKVSSSVPEGCFSQTLQLTVRRREGLSRKAPSGTRNQEGTKP